MPKQIFFDGLNLSLKKGTGIATYTRVLLGLTRDLGYRSGVLYSRQSGMPRDELAREVAFFDADVARTLPPPLRWIAALGSFLSAAKGIHPKKIPVTGTVITEPLGSSWVASDEVYVASRVFDRARARFMLTGNFLKVKMPIEVDLFHWTYPLPITSNARANIYTVHDIISLRLPYTSLDWKRLYLQSMRMMLTKADHIVTVSENSKRDVMTYFGVEESRITNTYEAIHIPTPLLERGKDAIANELAGIFGLEMRNYLLFYGSLEPKKNIGRLVQAYLAANVNLPLVVVFAQSWLGEDDSRLITQFMELQGSGQARDTRKRIHRFEYMPFPLLMTLIQGARAVLLPSIYEGFGLPILEAMTLGTPVVTSTTSSTPEVAGDAAILVDPYNVDAIRDAIVTVASDRDLCGELQTKGLLRAKLFSLDAYRERVAKVYAAYT
jgi:glycosyltransferase involved in cell wall biosynthesis